MDFLFFFLTNFPALGAARGVKLSGILRSKNFMHYRFGVYSRLLGIRQLNL